MQVGRWQWLALLRARGTWSMFLFDKCTSAQHLWYRLNDGDSHQTLRYTTCSARPTLLIAEQACRRQHQQDRLETGSSLFVEQWTRFGKKIVSATARHQRRSRLNVSVSRRYYHWPLFFEVLMRYGNKVNLDFERELYLGSRNQSCQASRTSRAFPKSRQNAHSCFLAVVLLGCYPDCQMGHPSDDAHCPGFRAETCKSWHLWRQWFFPWPISRPLDPICQRTPSVRPQLGYAN